MQSSAIFYILIFLYGFSVVSVHVRAADNNTQCNAESSFQVYSKSRSVWRTVNFTTPKTNGSECWADAPVQFSSPEECARPCRSGEPPKTCYYRWAFEFYKTHSGACQLCQPSMNNSFLTAECQCILGDGADVSGIMTANRMYPGPAIQVCVGDHVVVDVDNKIAGNDITIHWHGLYQNGWQYSDGVPFLTQCPIDECTAYRYQFTTQNSGTFFWHAHSGLHKGEGMDGPIVIRELIEEDPNYNLYDLDEVDNIIVINDWLHGTIVDHIPGSTYINVGQFPDNFLINGKGRYLNETTGELSNTPLAVFNVKPGLRHRFRMINACSLICPVELTIAEHNVTIIAVDGSSVEPRIVTTLTSFSAERIDFILDASKPIATYWMQVRGLGDCADRERTQLGIMKYEGSFFDEPVLEAPEFNPGLPRGVIFNPINEVCNGTRSDVVCMTDLESADPIHYRLLKKTPDVQIFLPYFFHEYNISDLYKPNTYQRFVDSTGTRSVSAIVGGISYVNPPSPYISQLEDIPPGIMCDSYNLPAQCANTTVCFCSHVRHVPLNAVVEVILVDRDATPLSHPFHLHGYGFHVMAMGFSIGLNITEENRANALQLSRQVYPPRNNHPPVKDTLAVPANGYTIVRFIADNPGWWFYHCHFLPHLYNGMAFVLRVGEQEDLPPTPPNFPTCGDFTPPVQRSTPKSRRKVNQHNAKVLKAVTKE